MKKLMVSLLAVLMVLTSAPVLLASGPDEMAEEEYALESMEQYDTLKEDAVAADVAELTVKARSAALMESKTGRLLFEDNAHEKRSPASVTKVMTLLLIMEALDAKTIAMEDVVTASPEACAKGGSQIWLEPGEQMSVRDLLKAVTIQSANDASVALAELIAGSEESFVGKMNQRAAELGMVDTNFENCTGLDDTAENHYTSAYDIALMSCELLKHEAIFEFTTVWMDSLRDGKTELVNTNRLVRFYEGATGLKTGTTAKAGKCVAASARKNNMDLVAVVLGSDTSDDRFNSARSMLNWGFAHFSLLQPEIDYNMITPVTISFGMYDSVIPIAQEVPYILIPKGREGELKTDYSFNKSIEAPVEKGQILGRVNISLDGEDLAQICLISPEAVERMTFPRAFVRLLGKVFRK